MPVPPFEPDGTLGPGPVEFTWDGQEIFGGHLCTYDELREHLVGRYPESLTRLFLYREIEQYAASARRLVRCFDLLVSGAFVTNVDSPRDVSLVVLARGSDVERLASEDRWTLSRLFDDRQWDLSSDEELVVTTGLALAYPADHSRFEEMHQVTMIHRLHAANPVGGAEGRGYLEILDCDEEVVSYAEVGALT